MTTLFTATEPDVVELVLPWPPSINHYWPQMYNKKLKRIVRFISPEGKVFRDLVMIAVRQARPMKLKGDLRFEATFNPPNNLRRDIDNLPKALLDALTKAGVFNDDSQIREMELRFGPVVKDGRAVCRVSTLGL